MLHGVRLARVRGPGDHHVQGAIAAKAPEASGPAKAMPAVKPGTTTAKAPEAKGLAKATGRDPLLAT